MLGSISFIYIYNFFIYSFKTL